MTRIVAGRAGGRRLRVPPKGTRPTTERVREALFNALQVAGEVDGARVLDIYAGSGALGLEALSRGAAFALFVESDRTAAEVLRGNIGALGLGGSVRLGKAETVLAEPAPEPFDLVVLDPPFALEESRLAAVLAALPAGGWTAPGSLVVVERPVRTGGPRWPEDYQELRTRRYGEAALYRAEHRMS
ncbi:16S rRNA (guanine(966)-N(2))-methyltransferase RsmD [Amycolatopsis cihanbeyliensis]|uniref:16S rRNA (Guanine966-N2)-methyltransferase n=1 Tax=Amycolatopsis cihanbeyliensis TaxID=1128664 RepID=A0A542DH13_AMYCI|nr:16S rRNA (guanine(966)-N(2))-methyltransferase RsmD [Amycolatopsis cihanbeyliensis]TQJ02373.1 16S rRNA (guanine966-N2)-methyltransferase [Amycolatopsis cihanbeyliensis]